MPINPLYYQESPGPQLAKDIMYKAPYEYLEKGEMAKAQTQALTKHTVSLLDSLLNSPALASKEEELQESNELYRTKIDELTNEIAGGNVTLETKNKIKGLARELSDDIRYGNRSIWTSQVGAKNVFIKNNIALAKSDPTLYNASLAQMEKKLNETTDKDELTNLSTLTLVTSPTFGLDNANNLAHFNKMLAKQTQAFYDTNKEVTDNAQKAFIKTIVASNPKEVKKFVEDYMKSIPGYSGYLASLKFAQNGTVIKDPLYGQVDNIWDPKHPYYNEAQAIKTALTTYASSLAPNPAYQAELKYRQQAAKEAEEAIANIPLPTPNLAVKTNNIKNAYSLVTNNSVPQRAMLGSRSVINSAASNLYNPKAPTGKKGFDIYHATKGGRKPWDLSNPEYTGKNAREEALYTPNQQYINRFTNVIPSVWADATLGRATAVNLDKEKIGKDLAVIASEVIHDVRLNWEINKSGAVGDLTDETWKQLTKEIYPRIKSQFGNLSKGSIINIIENSIRTGLAPAVADMAKTRNIINNTEYEFEAYPVASKPKEGMMISENEQLKSFINGYADIFQVHEQTDEEESFEVKSLQDLLNNNEITTIISRNAPSYFGAMSYNIKYKPKGSKSANEKNATIILTNIDSDRGGAAFKDLQAISVKYGNMQEAYTDEHGFKGVRQRKSLTDKQYAIFMSSLYSMAPIDFNRPEGQDTYKVTKFWVDFSAAQWCSFGANPRLANDLAESGVEFNPNTNTIIIPANVTTEGWPVEQEIEDFFTNLPTIQ